MSQQTVAKADLVSSHQDEDIAKITQRLFRSHTSFMESSTPSDQYWHPRKHPKFSLGNIAQISQHWMGDLLSPNGTVIAKVKLLSPRGNNCKVLFNNKVDKQNFYSFLTTEYSNKFRTLALLYQENLIDKNEWLQEQNNIAAGYCLYLYDKQYPKKLCDFTAQAKAIWAQHERELKKIKKIAKPTPVNSIKTLEKIAFTPHKHRVDPLLPIPFNYSKPKESKILFSSKLYDTEGIFVGAVEKKKTTRALFSIVFANEQAKSLLMQEVHEADYSNDVWSGFKGKTRIKEANLISHYLNFIYLSQFPAK